MFDMEVKMSPGDISVQTTSERGHTPEELSANAVAKIINISETADPIIKNQAEAFRERMFYVIVHALKQGIKSDRTTLYLEGERPLLQVLETHLSLLYILVAHLLVQQLLSLLRAIKCLAQDTVAEGQI